MSQLEKLLLKINEVKTLTESQTDEALSTALQTKVQSFVEESLTNKKDQLVEGKIVKEDVTDYEEEVVGDTSAPDTDSAALSAGDGDADDTTQMDGDGAETGMDASTDMTPDTTGADMTGLDTDDMGTADDDEVLDLSDATIEEVMEKLASLPDDTVIQIVKNKPTFDVKASEDITGDNSVTNEEKCDECLDEDVDKQIDEWIEEALKESADQMVADEYKTMLEQYEKKIV